MCVRGALDARAGSLAVQTRYRSTAPSASPKGFVLAQKNLSPQVQLQGGLVLEESPELDRYTLALNGGFCSRAGEVPVSVTTEVAPLVRVVSVAMVTVMVLDAPAIGLLCPIDLVVNDCAIAPPASSPSMSSKYKYPGGSFQDPILELRRALRTEHSPPRSSRLRSPAHSSSQRPPSRVSLAILGISRGPPTPLIQIPEKCGPCGQNFPQILPVQNLFMLSEQSLLRPTESNASRCRRRSTRRRAGQPWGGTCREEEDLQQVWGRVDLAQGGKTGKGFWGWKSCDDLKRGGILNNFAIAHFGIMKRQLACRQLPRQLACHAKNSGVAAPKGDQMGHVPRWYCSNRRGGW